MNETDGSRGGAPRRLGRVVIPIVLGAVVVAVIRLGVGLVPQNPFVGLFLIIATTALTITVLLRAGGV
ncbi:hypothetical protein [Brachybacterium sp. AOP3-A1-3]|uniref:hypothetical protein n=1 Tax=Brachybacterium sp. AOP3-A1-3 TaxID=3457699 RepID=UPI004033F45B